MRQSLTLLLFVPVLAWAFSSSLGRTFSVSPGATFQPFVGGPAAPGAQPLIPDDANTVAHLWVNGGQIIDTMGNVWTEHGTLTRTAKVPLIGFPNGAEAEGITDWSAANFLTLPPPTLNFAGNWLVVAIFGGAGGTGTFTSNVPAASNVGYQTVVAGGMTYSGNMMYTVAFIGMGASLTPPAGSSVGSVGQSNTTNLTYRKSNDTAVQTDLIGLTAGPAGAEAMTIGINTITGAPLESTAILCEVAFFAVAPTEAYINAIHLAVFGAF